MAKQITDSFLLQSTLPNFSRDLFSTTEEMKNFPESYLPSKFIAMNDEDGKIYIFNKSGIIDETYGKWTPFENVQTKTISSSIKSGSIVQYTGETTTEEPIYKKGHFYEVNVVNADISVSKGSPAAYSRISISSVPTLDIFLSSNNLSSGQYDIVYTAKDEGFVWKLNDIEIDNIASIGLSLKGTPAEGSIIVVNYTASVVTSEEISFGGGGGADIAFAEESEIEALFE